MRRIGMILTIVCLFVSGAFSGSSAMAADEEKEQELSLIIEVDGNPAIHKAHIEKHYPAVRVAAVYEKLFNGLALQGKAPELKKLRALKFVAATYPVQTYKSTSMSADDARAVSIGTEAGSGSDIFRKRDLRTQFASMKQQNKFVLPYELNDTEFTGKGVKVGVVDTGIDYTHPDLARNYKGGYDAVDLDDDPQETTPEQGIPTSHGSHVAGIIAANGNLKGVAPDAELYGYRALGPGGSGTSIQVLAAMEEAVKDGVDIMNLSLGNAVNGPDYPTSIAVNRAEELGVLVVVANGNDGPGDWTVGSPATANSALGVGAASHAQTIPVLVETLHKEKYPVNLLAGSPPWQLERGVYIANGDDPKADLRGKLAIVRRGKKTPFADKAIAAQERGAAAVAIYNHEKGDFRGSVEGVENALRIPVASLSEESGKWLKRALEEKGKLYLNIEAETVAPGAASFSSRGPVALNWKIKPDLLAPGTSVLSTVPHGYEPLQGTSMAAPHIAGVAALLKEAHPDWSNRRIISAMKTTARRVENDGVPLAPNVQGMGLVKPHDAMNAEIVIDEPLLSFGKTARLIEKTKTTIEVENISSKPQTMQFQSPKQDRGLVWQLPDKFTIPAGGNRKVEIGLDIRSPEQQKGIIQGWLSLERENGEATSLPYMFINETAGEPKASGLNFGMKPFANGLYEYELHLSEGIRHAEVVLYNPESLMRVQTLLQVDKPEVGMNKGTLKKQEVPPPGVYFALITVELEDGTMEMSESWMQVESFE